MGELTQEQFDRLLGWLDADRNAAGLQYKKIHLRLIKIFACRGCYEAEQLADETIDRVAAKMDWLITNYIGDPVLYFYGVAQKVHLEYLRKKPLPKLPPPPAPNVEPDEAEREFNCLDQCLEQLPTKSRDLVAGYYQGEKKVKINNRKNLAEELGITLDALRIRAHRIRRQLQQCVFQCVELSPVN
jgi:DNA-directed RNA polymerase specialized sigma24 family protein